MPGVCLGGGGGEWAPLDLTDTKCAVETFWAMSLVGIFPSWASELSQLSSETNIHACKTKDY